MSRKQIQPPAPRLELLSHAVMTVAPPEILERTPAGERRMSQAVLHARNLIASTSLFCMLNAQGFSAEAPPAN